MRFIIHELPYERPLLAGQLRYERDGQPTGAVESWRLTSAMDGYRFLRVDLDARAAPSGRSSLYHATLNLQGVLEQLKYRFWGDGLEISGTIVHEGDHWLAGRTVNGIGYQDEAVGTAFWFPSGLGLSLLRNRNGELSGVTLNSNVDDAAQAFALQEVDFSVRAGLVELLQVNGEAIPTIPYTVDWAGNRRIVWMDDEGRSLRLWRDDGLVATAARLVRFR